MIKRLPLLINYENAELEAEQIANTNSLDMIQPLSGSCICCSGMDQLRASINSIPERSKGITFIEANGTTDASALMGFLGVGINARFLPPVQISVVDVGNWQQRGEHNDLEANQVQLSALHVLTHTQAVSHERLETVRAQLHELNSVAEAVTASALNDLHLTKLIPTTGDVTALDHHKAHWASCSIDLPALPNASCINAICRRLPDTLLRVKGCAKVGNEVDYTYFERDPNGIIGQRPFRGEPTTGAKLLTVGPGSDPALLKQVVAESLA